SSSLTPYCTSCEKQFPKNGTTSELRSQTTFESSLTRNFGFWSDRDIDNIVYRTLRQNCGSQAVKIFGLLQPLGGRFLDA
ncbi:MAG: hypothetical protein P8M25_21260, partial [Paracoccaceae bacterium]|nr:hypothetical protein [Paracoccaceae bacterium]